MDEKTFTKLLLEHFDHFDEKIETYREEILKFKNETFDRIDQVYGEVKAVREEQAFHQQSHDDMNERFGKIEAIPVIAHELKKKK